MHLVRKYKSHWGGRGEKGRGSVAGGVLTFLGFAGKETLILRNKKHM